MGVASAVSDNDAAVNEITGIFSGGCNISYFLQMLLYELILFYMTKKIPELVAA